MEPLYKYKNSILTFDKNNAVYDPVEYWNNYYDHREVVGFEYSEITRIFNNFLYNQNIIRRDYSEIKVLDCGCGNGGYMNSLYKEGYSVTGIDIVDKVKNKDLNFQIGDVRNLQFEDNSFDSTISFGMLGYFLDINKILSEMNRVTKMFGFIILRFSHLTFSRKLRALKEGIELTKEPDFIFTCFHDMQEIIEIANGFNWDLMYYIPDISTEIGVFEVNSLDKKFAATIFDYDTILMIFRKSTREI